MIRQPQNGQLVLCVMPPFEEERAYCFAHVGLSICLSVCLSVGPSVGPSVCNLFASDQ